MSEILSEERKAMTGKDKTEELREKKRIAKDMIIAKRLMFLSLILLSRVRNTIPEKVTSMPMY